MPEGPSIVILKEELQAFRGKKIISVTGNAKIDLSRIALQKVVDFKSWGKHTLICFRDFYLRIHLLMFGSCMINEQKKFAPRLSLVFKNGEINFYNCSIKLIDGDVNEQYDWETDLMSEEWNAKKAEQSVKKKKEEKVCDILLDQDIFSGLGNIMKNEILFRIRVHPESSIEALPAKKIKEMVKEAKTYSFEFYEWKKAFVFRAHWKIYKQKECPRCKIKTQYAYMGKTNRLTCFCSNCQQLYI